MLHWSVSNLIEKETWEIYFTVTMNQILWDTWMSLWTHPCRQRWQAERCRRCTGCTTSAGSPCNYGGWVTGPLGAPEWPAGADNKAESTLAVYLYVPQSSWYDDISCVCSHSLDAFFIDTDAPEQGFENLAERESKEANSAELQTVSHLLQDGRRLLLNVVSRPARLSGNLDNSKDNVIPSGTK